MPKIKEKNKFEPGDLVAVFGGEIGKEGSHADTVSICRVLVSGFLDLIVEDSYSSSYSRPSHHVVSKNICHKLSMSPQSLQSNSPLSAKLGDLVLSFSRDSFKDTPPVEKTGILYKITYKLGRPHRCTLLCGNEMEEVSYDSLIVLQRNENTDL